MAKIDLLDLEPGQAVAQYWESYEATYSYSDIRTLALLHTSFLQDIRPGAICVLSGFSPLEIWILMLAAWHVGASVLPLAADATPASIDLALKQLPYACHFQRARGIWNPTIPITVYSKEPEGLAPFASGSDLFIMTSGSTGTPKAIAHSLAGLLASAQATLNFYDWKPSDCWLLSLDPSHIGGLQILLRTWIGRGRCFYGGAPKDVGQALQYRPCDFLSLVPTQLFRLLEDDQTAVSLRQAKAILLGGAATQDSLLKALKELSLPVSITYGSSETASQISAFKPGLLPESKEHVGVLLPIWQVVGSPENDLWIKGPALMCGYWQHQIWYPIKDQVYLLSDRGRLVEANLYLEGRRDQVFQVGGENVAPSEILQVIESIYPLSDLQIVAKEDETFGTIPLLFVRSRKRPNHSALLESLLRLPPIKRPREIWWFQSDEVSKLSKAHLENLLNIEDAHMQRLWKYEKI